MKGIRKFIIASIAIALLSVFAGCSKAESQKNVSDNTKKATEKPYTVNFVYLVASEGTDQQAVEDAINKLTLKELNMNVHLIPMTWGTYVSQISLMLSSGEPMDIFPALSNQFATYIQSQYIVNADDYKEYTKDIYKTLGEDATAGFVGKFLVGFSNMKERAYPTGLVCRKDVMDELGLSPADFNVTTDDYSSFDQITELFKKVKAAHPNMICLDGSATMGTGANNSYVDGLGDPFGVLSNYGQTTKIANYFESDQYRKFGEINREWFTKGYSSSDIAVNTDSGEIKMKAGNCFSYVSYVKPNTDIEKYSQTGYKVEVIPLSKQMKSTYVVTADLLCVANASKDKVKAFKFLNWAYTSREFNDLINWGLEGKDWVETSDGMAGYPEGVTAMNVGYHNDFGYIYPNQFAGHPWEGNPKDIWQQYGIYNAGLMKSKAFGFRFDSTPVETQIAQLNAVFDQYSKDISFGAVEIGPALEKFNKALYAAGLQKVMDEKQKQLDAWLATQKK